MAGYHTGQVVYHAEYGTGRVVRVEGDVVTVNFIKAGPKFFTADEAEEVLSDIPLQAAGQEEDVDVDELFVSEAASILPRARDTWALAGVT